MTTLFRTASYEPAFLSVYHLVLPQDLFSAWYQALAWSHFQPYHMYEAPKGLFSTAASICFKESSEAAQTPCQFYGLPFYSGLLRSCSEMTGKAWGLGSLYWILLCPTFSPTSLCYLLFHFSLLSFQAPFGVSAMGWPLVLRLVVPSTIFLAFSWTLIALFYYTFILSYLVIPSINHLS